MHAHIFLCLLAYYVEWHWEARRPLLFGDEDQAAKATRDPVAPAQRFTGGALRMLHSKRLDDGSVVHSFQTLLHEVSGIARDVCRTPAAGPDVPTFHVVTQPSLKQKRVLKLLEAIAV